MSTHIDLFPPVMDPPAVPVGPVSSAMTPSPDELADFFAALITAEFDPNPVTWGKVDEVGVDAAKRAIRRAEESPTHLRRTVNRREFLAACLDFTEKLPLENLIVGLGSKRGMTTNVSAIMRVVGEAGSVNFTPLVATAVAAHYSGDHAAEVLIFHNHPPHMMNVILDNLPIASAADRRLMLTYVFNKLHLGKALNGGGRVRFFIGENGFVAEFTQPHWLDLLRSRGALN